MFKLNLYISYSNQKENTEINVEANYESSEEQNDQSPKGRLGLILDYLPLAVNMSGIIPIILDTFSYMT
jgi:preprotein translocase subunit SecY